MTKSTKCVEWEYNTTDSLGNTWTSEWDLVCDKKYLKLVAEMIFLVGVATGGIVSGMLSDKFGRKKMLFISALFQSFFGEVLKLLFFKFSVKIKGLLTKDDFKIPSKNSFVLYNIFHDVFKTFNLWCGLSWTYYCFAV